LLLHSTAQESIRVKREIRNFELLSTQCLLTAHNAEGSEARNFTDGVIKGMRKTLWEDIQGLPAPEKQKMQGPEARDFEAKKKFMKQSVSTGKKFGSLTDILNSLSSTLSEI